MSVNKKNLRRVSVVVTAQTLYHLRHLAAIAGYGEKDLGRVIDKLTRQHVMACGREEQHGTDTLS